MSGTRFMLYSLKTSRGLEERAWHLADPKLVAVEARCIRCGAVIERQEISTDNTREEIRAASESREAAWHHHLSEIHGEEP